MNPRRGQSASDWLAKATVSQLETILTEHSDEPYASILAKGMVARAAQGPIRRTIELAELVRELVRGAMEKGSREDPTDSVRRVFQALRIEVNDEFSALDTWLRVLPSCLKSGGRVAVLTFHSGEDRRVKHAFRDGERSGVYSSVNSEVVVAGPEERRSNPRSSSAKLRWAIRG
jgi:16S rRNA (cytosine1402-N4)-methyltransferase